MINQGIKDKTLFLWLDSNEFHAVNAQRRGVAIANVFRNMPKVFKAIRRLQIKLNVGSIYPWLDLSWVHNLDKYDTVIIHASKLTPPVVKYINKKKPDIRVIVWYWNPIVKSEPLESFTTKNCEIWVFDEQDAINHKLKHNTQYYFKDIHVAKKEKTNDVVFVGGDKGRLSYLLEIEKELKNIGIMSDFHIVGSSKFNKAGYKYNHRISYLEILEKIHKSKAILDVVSDNQSGLTLRPLEALFFNKKLITNDKSILNRDFYEPNNIFVLGVDEESELIKFLNKPMQEINSIIRDKYDFEEWLSRFNINKSS